MTPGKYYRVILTYNGFDEEKDEKIIRAVRKRPSQMAYDPVETRRTIDFVFRSHRAATNSRIRVLRVQQESGGFSVSKVIDDNF
jgi:hypothetical protein